MGELKHADCGGRLVRPHGNSAAGKFRCETCKERMNIGREHGDTTAWMFSPWTRRRDRPDRDKED